MINVVSKSVSPGLSKQMGFAGQQELRQQTDNWRVQRASLPFASPAKPLSLAPREYPPQRQEASSGSVSNIVSLSGNAAMLERDRAVSAWERDRAAAAAVIRATQLRNHASALEDKVGDKLIAYVFANWVVLGNW